MTILNLINAWTWEVCTRFRLRLGGLRYFIPRSRNWLWSVPIGVYFQDLWTIMCSEIFDSGRPPNKITIASTSKGIVFSASSRRLDWREGCQLIIFRSSSSALKSWRYDGYVTYVTHQNIHARIIRVCGTQFTILDDDDVTLLFLSTLRLNYQRAVYQMIALRWCTEMQTDISSSCLLFFWKLQVKEIVRRNLGFSSHLPHSMSSLMIGLIRTHPYHTLAATLFGCILFWQLKRFRPSNPKGLPLPPGPKGYPLIGNLFDMPINKPWLVYDEWCKTYGEPFMINGLSTRILFDACAF